MFNTQQQLDKSQVTRAGRGYGWLVLMMSVVAVGALVITAPEAWRGLAGGRLPLDEGNMPVAPAEAAGNLAARNPAAGLSAMSRVNVKVEAPVVAKTQAQSGPVTTGAGTGQAYPGEEQAVKSLAEAQAAYTAMNWAKARTAADRISQLKASPMTLSRAQDISRGAVALSKLFESLDDEEEELTRNYDTHPSLVMIGDPSRRNEAVPLVGDSRPPQPITDQDPVSFVEEARATGQVFFMLKGIRRFSKASFDTTRIGEVTAVDVPARIAERTAQLDAMIVRLRGDNAKSGDATNWYALGKFAYRNRIDKKVVELLDRAVLLEPNLVAVVRNDLAAILAASMTLHLRNGNQTMADPFMASIRRKYMDTDAGKMAAAEYEGQNAAMLAIARNMEKKRQDEEAARRADLKRRAEEKKAAGDVASAETLKKAAEEAAPEETDPAPAGPATPEGQDAPATSAMEAEADKASDQGRKLCAEAGDMPNGAGKNRKYEAAIPILRKAVGLYNKMMETTHKGDAKIETKMIAANQMLFLARKSITMAH